MKKRILAMLLIACTLVMTLSGCAKELYDYESYADYIILGDLKGVQISQSDIDDAIMDEYRALFTSDDKLEEKKYTSADTDITVIYGDKLVIDYIGTIDGVAFEGGTANDASLTIGSGAYIDGFEDGLKGHGAGEKVELNLTFPDPYAGDPTLAGKDVLFTVTIDSITRTVYPEYNDENVKKYSDNKFETVEAFEKEYKDVIMKNLLWKEYFTTCKVKKYPEKELTAYYEASVDSVKNTAAMFGMSISNFVVSYYGYADSASYYKYLASTAQSTVKNDLIVLATMETMPEIILSEQDFENKLIELFNTQVEEHDYTGSYEDFVKEYESVSLEISIYSDIIVDMIFEDKIIYDDVTKNGFVSDRNGVRYYKDGEYFKGWVKLDIDGKGEKDYYFDEETGYAPDTCDLVTPLEGGDAKYLEFGKNGLYVGLYSGIYKDGTGTRYFVNGEMKKGVINLDLDEDIEGEEEYYFDNTSGYMVIGIGVGPDGLYHDYGENGVHIGVVPDGLVSDKNGTRYFKDGMFISGWINDKIDADNNGEFEKYYFDIETGLMYVNDAKVIEGVYYVFDENGILVGIADGLYKNSTGIRLFNEGELLIGLQEYKTEDGVTNTYYFKPGEGYAIVSDWYSEDVNGETVNKYYFDENGYKVVNKTIKIGDKEYTFDAEGNVVTK